MKALSIFCFSSSSPLHSLSLFLYFFFRLYFCYLILSRLYVGLITKFFFLFSFIFYYILLLTCFISFSVFIFPLCLGLIMYFSLLVYSRTIVQLDIMLAMMIISKMSKLLFPLSLSPFFRITSYSLFYILSFFLALFPSPVFMFSLLGSPVSVRGLNCKSFLFEVTFTQLCN